MVAPQNKPVRQLVNSLGHRAANLYSTTKDASPQVLQSGFTSLETIFTPYRDPVVNTWKERADPLLDIVDDKLTEKLCASEEYLKSSVQVAQNRVKLAHDQVHSHVKPYVASTEQAIGKTRVYVENKSMETYQCLLSQADKAVDFVLPEVTAPQAEEAPKSPREHTTRLTKKVTTRLSKRVTDVCTYSNERAKQIVHIDLIAYAKETVDASEEKLAQAFDKVIDLLPSPETTQKFFDRVIERVPKQARPLLTKGSKAFTPLVGKVTQTVTSFLLFIRSFVVATKPVSEPKEQTKAFPTPKVREETPASQQQQPSETTTTSSSSSSSPNGPTTPDHADHDEDHHDLVHSVDSSADATHGRKKKSKKHETK